MREIVFTIETYDKIAKKYEKKYGELSESEKPYLYAFYQLTESEKPKILDAGCGTGRDLAYLENLSAELYGVDLSEGMLNLAKNKLKNTSLIKADIRKLPFPDNFFDGVLSIASLVHLPHKEKAKAINEFWRVLKPNGVLYICIQNLLYPPRFKRCEKYKVKNSILYDGRYWYFPTKFSMEDLLKREDFEIRFSPSFPSDERLRFYCLKVLE